MVAELWPQLIMWDVNEKNFKWNPIVEKSLSVLGGNNTNVKVNTRFITSQMCSDTLSFYKEILAWSMFA